MICDILLLSNKTNLWMNIQSFCCKIHSMIQSDSGYRPIATGHNLENLYHTSLKIYNAYAIEMTLLFVIKVLRMLAAHPLLKQEEPLKKRLLSSPKNQNTVTSYRS